MSNMTTDRPKICPACTSGNIQMIDTNEYYCIKCGHQWKQKAGGKPEEVLPVSIPSVEETAPVPIKKRTEGEVVEPRVYSQEEIAERLSETDSSQWETKGDPINDLVKAKEELSKDDDFTRIVVVPDGIKAFLQTPKGKEIHHALEMATGYKLIFKTPKEIFGG